MRISRRGLLVTRTVALLAFCATGCQFATKLDEPLRLPPSDGGAARDGSAASAYASAVLSDAPILYLRFSETSGARAADRSVRDAEVNLSGASQRGRASLIAGDSDPSVGLVDGAQLVLDPAFDFPLEAAFTYELWVRLSTNGEVMANLINKPALVGTALFVSATSPYFGFERWSEESSRPLRSAHVDQPTPPGAGGIYHLVIVNRRDRIAIFINGARREGTITRSGTLKPASLILGGATGDYDELAIYDRELPDARIVAHYALGRGR